MSVSPPTPSARPAALRLSARGVALPAPEPDLAARLLRDLFVGSYLGLRAVCGTAADLDTVRGWVAELPTETIIGRCSSLSRLLTLPLDIDPTAKQREIAANLVSPILAPEVDALLRDTAGPTTVLVTHESLLLTIKLAILHGQPGPPTMERSDHRWAVGRIVLAINDLLDCERINDLESDRLLGFVVRGLSLTSTEEFRYLIGRMYDLLVRWPPRVSASALLDFDADFTKAVGMSVREFMAVATYCMVSFTADDGSLSRRLGAGGFWKAGPVVASAVVGRFGPSALDHLAGDRAWFTKELDDGRELALSSFLPFHARPYYRLERGGLIPINERLAQEKVAVGPFWMLHEAMRNIPRGIQTLMGDFGLVFERYVDDLVARSTPAAVGVHLSGYGQTYLSTTIGSTAEGSDTYILASDGNLVLFESTASSVPVADLLSGDGARFRLAFQNKMVMEQRTGRSPKPGKLAQLDRVILDLAAGDRVHPHLDPSRVRAVHPVLVTLTPLPQLANIRSVIDAMLKKAGLFAPQKGFTLHPPVLISVEELEMLEGALRRGETTLLAVLARWRAAIDHDSSLKNHLARTGFQEEANPYLGQRYTEYVADVNQILKARGLA